jgi:hypothetical protein
MITKYHFVIIKWKPLRGNPSIKTKVIILIRERSELSEAKRRRRHDRQIVERSEILR